MADKKTIKDLNSLIRFDERKRLKLPAKRPSIDSSIGYASVADTDSVETEQFLYVRMRGYGVTDDDVYRFDGIGSAPDYVSNAGGNAGLGILNQVVYGAERGMTDIYKNYPEILLTTLAPVECVYTNTNHIIVFKNNRDIERYTHAGVFVDSFSMAYANSAHRQMVANNNIIVSFSQRANPNPDSNGIDSVVITNVDGTYLSTTDLVNDHSSMFTPAVCSNACIVIDFAVEGVVGGDHVLKVFNNEGLNIATVTIDGDELTSHTGSVLSTVAMTNSHLFLFSENYSGISTLHKCAIYSHTITGGSVATGYTLGAYVATVDCPTQNSVEGLNISSSMDAFFFFD